MPVYMYTYEEQQPLASHLEPSSRSTLSTRRSARSALEDKEPREHHHHEVGHHGAHAEDLQRRPERAEERPGGAKVLRRDLLLGPVRPRAALLGLMDGERHGEAPVDRHEVILGAARHKDLGAPSGHAEVLGAAAAAAHQHAGDNERREDRNAAAKG